jgi:hypothetical protein
MMRRLLVAGVVISSLALGRGVSLAGGEEAPALPPEEVRSLVERVGALEAEVRRLKGQAGESQATAEGGGQTPAGEAGVGGMLSAMEKRLSVLEEGTAGLWGIEVGGMLYTSYGYNFNTPAGRDNALRVFDTDHNDLSLDLFQFTLSKETEAGLGFTAVLDFGETAEGVAADWDGDGELSSSEETNSFELQEAYVTYTLPWGRGLELKGGKFVTLLGAEVIESPSNDNISRSFLFGFAIPFTHTGLLLTYPLTDTLSLTAGVVNGWDNVDDSNDGKTFLGSLAVEPWPWLSWTFNGVFGPEQAGRGGSKRGVFDTVLTLSPLDDLRFTLNYDRGSESGILEGGREATWQGVAGIVTVGGALFSPRWTPFSLAVRGEWFSDEDGTRTGDAQDLWEVTTTLKWQIGKHLAARLEYRHDESNRRVFFRDGRLGRQQNTLGAEIAYVF